MDNVTKVESKTLTIMETLRKFILFGFIGTLAMFTACEEEEEKSTMDKEEATEVLQTSNQDIESDLEAMGQTEGMKAMETLNTINQQQPMPFSFLKSSENEETIIRSIQKSLKPYPQKNKRAGSEPFDFDSHTGTYSWDNDSMKWNVSSTPADAIVIEFPTGSMTDPNNAVFAITDYSEVEITVDGETEYAPTNILANMTIDGEEYMSITYSSQFSNGEISSMDMDITLTPFNYIVSMEDNSVSASISKDGATVLSTNLTFTFVSDEMEDVEKVEGNLQVRNMNFKGWIEPYALSDTASMMENAQSTSDLIDYFNNHFSISLYEYDSGNKIADLKVVEAEGSTGAAGEYPIQLVFVFDDGSTELVQEYFQGVANYLEGLLGNYDMKNINI